MKPEDFVSKYYGYARQVEADTGIFSETILTRAAIESGWGEYAIGNNFFGIKDTDGINGNEQLITTTEYMKSPKASFPVILSVMPFGKSLWKYKVKDYFRKYDSPYDSFHDFALFILKNPRYKEAVSRNTSSEMGAMICRAGYATDPSAIDLTIKVNAMIENIVKNKKLR